MTERLKFVKRLFVQLHDYQYVLLKHIDFSIEEISDRSDLDFLISKTDFTSLFNTFGSNESIKKINIKNQNTMSQVFIFFQDNSYLQLDFLFGFYRKELVYLQKGQVFQFSKANQEGVNICNDRHLFEHLLLFNFLNFSGIPKKYIDFFRKQGPEETKKTLDYIQAKYQCNIESLSQLNSFNPLLRKALYKYLLKQQENKGFRRLKNRINYSLDVLKSIFSNRGFIMTFSGVDGAGKSTIIENVKEKLENKYRRNVVVLRHRPSIFPILSAFQYGKEKAEKRTIEKLPRQGNNNSVLSSIVRFSYYYLDYLLGQFYVKARYVWQGYVVIYDRYYFDFIVDGKRSNIQLSQTIPKFLYRFVTKPTLNLFLYASPETILKRKRELTEDSIKELTKNYKTLFKTLENKRNKNQYLPIENLNQEKTLNQIIEQYEAMV